MLETRPLYLYQSARPSQRIQDSIEDFFQKSWNEKHNLPDHTYLYHYTDLSGIKGIVSSRSFWHSHASSLNDPLEIQHGQRIVAEKLGERTAKADREDIRSFLSTLSMQVRNFGTIVYHTFAFCFCESGNLLSQWRAYADQGGGYCLGFEFSNHTVSTPEYGNASATKPITLRKVIYSLEEQASLVNEYLETVLPTVTQHLDELPEDGSDRLIAASTMAMQACNVLLDMVLCFKSPAFQEEQEWRIVKVTREDFQPENLSFKTVKQELVPYRSLLIYEDVNRVFPLKTIRHGPSLDAQRTRAGLELYVRNQATGDSPIHLLPDDIQVQSPGFSLR